MRLYKLFLTLLLICTACIASAQAVTYRSTRSGSTIQIELRMQPKFHAVVYEPTYGHLEFAQIAADKDGSLFENKQIGMQLFLTIDVQNALFISATDKELYTVDLGGYSSGYNSGYSSGVSTPRRDKCYTCWGMLRCPVCHGAGHGISYVGSPSPCTACGGSGICYHCHGTGLQ